jgi:hypothetical protein
MSNEQNNRQTTKTLAIAAGVESPVPTVCRASRPAKAAINLLPGRSSS